MGLASLLTAVPSRPDLGHPVLDFAGPDDSKKHDSCHNESKSEDS